jgi:DNA-binding NtrC family response regulator
MLLRVIEQRTARPVGGSTDYPVHCRFIAAANRDLKEMVRQGSFREDLWYRIGLFPIQLPPLRKRVMDIPILALRFAMRFSATYKKQIVGIEASAISRLEKHNWPGNVRELQNVIERAVIVCEQPRIGLADLADHLGEQTPMLQRGTLDDSLREMEIQLVNTALRDSNGSLTHAAAALGLNRTTLHYRLKRLGIKRRFH